MATVTLNGVTYDSADLSGGGHLDPVKGFFAILTAMVAELDAAETVQAVAPGAAGNVLTARVVNGSLVWTSEAPAPAGDPTLASNNLAVSFFSF